MRETELRVSWHVLSHLTHDLGPENHLIFKSTSLSYKAVDKNIIMAIEILQVRGEGISEGWCARVW